MTAGAGTPHALVAARLSAEHGIGVRHGCFCAHPYLIRLLGLSANEIAGYWDAVRHHDRRHMPGAVPAGAGLSTTEGDIDRLGRRRRHRVGPAGPRRLPPGPRHGDFHVEDGVAGWPGGNRALGASCARG